MLLMMSQFHTFGQKNLPSASQTVPRSKQWPQGINKEADFFKQCFHEQPEASRLKQLCVKTIQGGCVATDKTVNLKAYQMPKCCTMVNNTQRQLWKIISTAAVLSLIAKITRQTIEIMNSTELTGNKKRKKGMSQTWDVMIYRLGQVRFRIMIWFQVLGLMLN